MLLNLFMTLALGTLVVEQLSTKYITLRHVKV